jgi:hypothetical protein
MTTDAMIRAIVNGKDIRVRLEYDESLVVESYMPGDHGLGARGTLRARITHIESAPETKTEYDHRLKRDGMTKKTKRKTATRKTA